MAVMIMALSATIMLSFGSESLLVGGENTAGALSRAQTMIERAQSLARQDYHLVLPVAPSTDGIYTQSLAIVPWEDDLYTTERVTATVSWMENGRSRSVSLDTLVGNVADATGGDTCSAVATDGWDNPQIADHALASLVPSASTRTIISSLDAYRGTLYVALEKTAQKTDDDLFVFDAVDLHHRNAIDTDAASVDGTSAITTGGRYVYAVNAHPMPAADCVPASACSQLLIFDVASLAPFAAYAIPGTYSSNGGASIRYKDGYAYLGLNKVATGAEFAIVDVHDPLAPQWVGGYAVGATVNAIAIRHGYAYLATDDPARDLVVLDIRDPAHPSAVATYNAPNPHGESLHLRGDTLWLGSTPSFGAPELRVFDITRSTPSLTTSQRIGSSVAGIVIRGHLLFVLTSTTRQVQIYDISNPTAFVLKKTLPLPGIGAALECEGDTLWAASNDGATGYLSVITADI